MIIENKKNNVCRFDLLKPSTAVNNRIKTIGTKKDPIMKKQKYYFITVLAFLLATMIYSCSETDYKTFDRSVANIYFTTDSVAYSFGTVSLSETTHVMELPVTILGSPSQAKRQFKIEVIQDKTNAVEGVHYTLPSELTIEPDSVNGIIPLQIHRSELENVIRWQVGFRLVSNENFTAASEIGDQIVASFNNIIEPPAWTDWQGNPTWPQGYLGIWNPLTWYTFMQYFREMEKTSPETYHAMIEQYGPNLEKVTYGWPNDYKYSVKKYILIPMYNYFQLHPELGVSMPNPYLYD